jgi:hypothetical protein
MGHAPQGVDNLLIKLPRWAGRVPAVPPDGRTSRPNYTWGQLQHESRPRGGTADIYPASQSQTSYKQLSQFQHPGFWELQRPCLVKREFIPAGVVWAGSEGCVFRRFGRWDSTTAGAQELGFNAVTSAAGSVRPAGPAACRTPSSGASSSPAGRHGGRGRTADVAAARCCPARDEPALAHGLPMVEGDRSPHRHRRKNSEGRTEQHRPEAPEANGTRSRQWPELHARIMRSSAARTAA